MKYSYNRDLKTLSQNLRKNMTRQERRLWYECLKNCSKPFYRQKVIENYIVDFFCPSARIVIELDGSQHFEPDASEKDTERDKRLETLGFKVLRFSNSDIDRDFEAVANEIIGYIE